VKKKVSSALAALAVLAAGPAHAALSINLTLPSATFGNPSVFCSTSAPCAFTDTITFTAPYPYNLVSAAISTIAYDGIFTASDINLTSVTLDGVAFSLSRLLNGVFEVGAMSETSFVPLDTHTLTISGISYGTNSGLDGSYSGTLTFASNLAIQSPIPEPATWMSWMLGLATICHSRRRTMRQRKRQEMWGYRAPQFTARPI
jgi:hypothetical protein